MQSVLIIEDNKELASTIIEYLSEKGYEAALSESIRHASERMRNEKYDICILDIGLPDGTGFELCEKMRTYYVGPILILTAYNSEDDIIRGLQCGADDYIAKPCSLRVLNTRMQALLRRSKWDKEKSKYLISGDMTVDIEHKTVRIKDELVPLGKTEIELILAIIQGHGQIMPRNMLLEKIWDSRDNYIEDNTLSVHVSRLRNKLCHYGGVPYIETVKGIGYRWSVDVRRGCDGA